jgi:tetratricopeptide (TPR) repeat protein
MSLITKILCCLAILSMIVVIGCRNPYVTAAHIDLEQLNNPDKALEDLNQALKQNPNDPEAFFLLGKVYWIRKEYSQMMEFFNKSLQLSDGYKSQIDEICDDLWKNLYNDEGVKRFNSRDYLGCIQALDTAAIVLPHRWETYYLEGLAYENLEQRETAAEKYRKAVEVQTGTIDLGPVYNLANVLFQLKQYEECLRYAQLIINDSKDDSMRLDAVKISASALGHLKRPADAVKMYDRIIDSEPDDADPYYDRAILFLELGDTTKAIADFEKTLALDPKDLDAMEQLGLIYLESTDYLDYAKALAIFQKANEMQPHTYSFVRGIGKALVRLDRSEEAAPYLEEATALLKEMQKK